MISNLEGKSSKKLSDIFTEAIHEIETLAGQAPVQIIESVHLIRKRIKFLRAFVKLTRFCTDGEKYKPVNYLLRDCGKTISDCRDAHVRKLLLEEFAQVSSLKKQGRELNHINDSITEEIENDLLSGTTIFDELVDELASTTMSEYFKSLKPNADCLISGLALGYEKSYHAFHSELKNHEADLLHEWRKRTKDLQYQLEALPEFLPNPLFPPYEEVAALCEKLGRINDLFMFLEWLDSVDTDVPLMKLQKKLKKELKALEKQADTIGNSLLKLSPEDFEDELRLHL